MARIRYLKPDFFKDEDIAGLSHQTRLFFQGLWTQADRAGRLEDRPKRLKVEIFPYEEAEIEPMLKALAKSKSNSQRPFIIRYEIDGERYIQILSWNKHQKPHHTEMSSEIPPYNPPKENGKDKDKDKDKDKCQEPLTELNISSKTVKNPLNKNINALFDDIWMKYPKRIGKKQAKRHFLSSVKTQEDFEMIQKALNNYLQSERVLSGYIQNGATWFNNWQDWLDYSEPVCPKCKGKGIITSERGYEKECDCPAGMRKKAK